MTVATLTTSDVDANETFTYTIVGGPDAGNFSIDGNSLVIDDGILDFETQNQYEVVVRVTDSGGLEHDETIRVGVLDLNEAPVVNNNGGTVVEGETIAIDSSVLSATDPEQTSSELVYTLDSIPANGTLLLNGQPVAVGTVFTQDDIDSGALQYTHSGSETTTDSFEFSVTDGQGQTVDNQVFDISITPANDIPVANSDSFTTDEDTPLNSIDLLSNDIDADGDDLTVTITSGPNQGGSVEVNVDGTVNYQPAENFNGVETFEYEISDGNGGVSVASVTINVAPVNDAPFVEGDFYEVVPGEPLVTVEGVLANDFDPEGSALTAILLEGPPNGTLELQPNGQFTYTPNANFSGVDTFTYLATDGETTTAATVQIVVTGGVINPIETVEPPAPVVVNPPEPTTIVEEPDSEPNTNDNDDDDAEVVGNGIFPPLQTRNVNVVDLRDSGFTADVDFADLVLTLSDSDRAKTVLTKILQSVSEADLANERSSLEIEQFRAAASFATVFDAQFLFDQIEDVDLSNSVFGDLKVTVGAVTAFGTIGYVLWALRGGALVALALSQVPAWQMIDPLPILDGYNNDKKRGDKEDLEGFFSS